MSILEYVELIAFYLFVAIFLYKTKIYKKTFKLFKKIIPPIYIIIIVLYPFFIFLLYIIICNFIISENIEPTSIGESNNLINIVLNKIISYFFGFIFWTLIASLLYYIIKGADKDNNDNELKRKIYLSFKRANYLIYVSNILFLFFEKTFNLEAIQYIKNYNFSVLNITTIFSDDSIKIVTLSLLSLLFYFFLFFMSADFLNDTVTAYNKLYTENKIYISYKILMYIPIINILFFHHIKAKYFCNFITQKSRNVL